MNFMLCSSFFKTNCWGKQSVSQPCHPSVSKPFLNGNPLLSLCLFSCQPVNKFFRMLNVNLEMLFLTESILKQMFQKTLPLTVCGAFWYCLLIFNFLKKKIPLVTHSLYWLHDPWGFLERWFENYCTKFPQKRPQIFYFKMHVEYLARIEHGKGRKASTFKIW